MKKITYLILLFVISSLAFSGCEKDNKEEKITPSMTATIDGEEWVSAGYSLDAYYFNGEYLNLSGSVSSTNAIDIKLKATSTGTYSFEGGYESKAIYTKDPYGTGIPRAYTTEANSGQVTITEFSSSVVKGTFSFTAYGTFVGNLDSVVVENGAFTLEYITTD